MSMGRAEESKVAEVARDARLQNDKWQYLIKWQGHPESENTWEYEEDLEYVDVIRRFQEQFPELFHVMKHPDFVKPGEGAPETTSSQGASTSAPQVFDHNRRADKIIRVTKSGDGEIKFLIKWKGSDEVDWVSAKEANVKYPQEVIAYYAKQLPHSLTGTRSDGSKKISQSVSGNWRQRMELDIIPPEFERLDSFSKLMPQFPPGQTSGLFKHSASYQRSPLIIPGLNTVDSKSICSIHKLMSVALTPTQIPLSTPFDYATQKTLVELRKVTLQSSPFLRSCQSCK
ncbi:hypothetical protein Aperf_G00000121812 [Anoplocephala perfoliata]